MNHTIKGIIIVAAITSMLVLGATTMVPIMQNASARSTNTNTNTNSADSSSSSNATADNTNNIDNTATASSNQNACAVAVTCSQGTTTETPPVPVDNCPAGTLYDVTTTLIRGGLPTTVELCLPGNPGGNPLGPQTATIAGTTTTIPVVISFPNTAICPRGSGIRAEVTSGQENVPGLNTFCVAAD
jgi:hypothetical protein